MKNFYVNFIIFRELGHKSQNCIFNLTIFRGFHELNWTIQSLANLFAERLFEFGRISEELDRARLEIQTGSDRRRELFILIKCFKLKDIIFLQVSKIYSLLLMKCQNFYILLIFMLIFDI